MTPTDTVKLDREAIRARVEAASPGPWQQTRDVKLGVKLWSAAGKRLFLIAHDWQDSRISDAEPEPQWQRDCDFVRHAREDIPALLAALAQAEKERDARAAEARHWAEGTRAYMKRLDAAEAQLRAAGVTRTPLTSEGGHDANADTDGETAAAQRRDAEGNAGGDADVSGMRAPVGDEGISVHGPADGGQGVPVLQGRAGGDVAARPFTVELPGAIALIHRAERAEARADAAEKALRNIQQQGDSLAKATRTFVAASDIQSLADYARAALAGSGKEGRDE